MSMVTVQCPRCGTPRPVDDKYFRRMVRCQKCEHTFTGKTALAVARTLEGQEVEGKYVLRELLGEGGFALVYRADEYQDGQVKQSVAVKLIFPDHEMAPEQQVDELVAALRMEHQYIVHGVSAGVCELGGVLWLYLVMELAEETLEERMRQGPMHPREAWVVTEHVTLALAYLHKDPGRFVHRDIKPANILRVGGNWKLADFGLIYAMERAAKSERQQSGTERFMPPEGYEGMVTPAWDMWSLGVMLVEMFTGKHPFENDRHLYYAITQMEPDMPPDLPAPFNEIIRGCLIKKRSIRWTAPQVLSALNASRGLRAIFAAYGYTFNKAVRRLEQQARAHMELMAAARKKQGKAK